MYKLKTSQLLHISCDQKRQHNHTRELSHTTETTIAKIVGAILTAVEHVI